MRSLNIKAVFQISVLFCFIIFGKSFATTAIRQSLDKLKEKSTDIVSGKVLNIHSYWNNEKTHIFTDIEMEVEENYKSTSSKKITLVLPGGTVEKTTTFVPGGPSFQINEEVLLFLKQIDNRQAAYKLANFIQGKFKILWDDKLKEKTIISETVGKISLAPDSDGISTPDGGKEGMLLNDFVKKLGNNNDE